VELEDDHGDDHKMIKCSIYQALNLEKKKEKQNPMELKAKV
jgi:hypothetical protein